MRQISLMTFFSSVMTSFQLKPPPPFPLHPLQSYPVAVSPLFSISLGFDKQHWVSTAHSARRGKLIRDQINRAAPEEPGVSLPLLKDCPGWGGGRDVHQENTLCSSAAGTRPCPCAVGRALPKPLQLCSFVPPEGMAPAPEKQMHCGC